MAESYNITDDFKEEVRSATNIVNLIGRHVQLRKRGKNYLGLCPFHDDHNPSFNVSPDRQMYRCFSCGASGDVFTFLMEFENMNFIDAVVELAKEAGLKIPVKSQGDTRVEAERTRLVEANEAALRWFRGNLEQAAEVKKYLVGRGLSEATIDEFEIGFAPDGWDNLLSALGKEFGETVLEKAGLIQPSSRDGRMIDRFRSRIIVPIRAAGGRLVSFGGRIFGDGEPKYMNGPETLIFNKSRVLFGLHRGQRVIRRGGFAVLVEGYFDAIALHQAGFANAVAPLGTSLAEDHARLLQRYCSKVIVCMDADDAGRRAAVRSAGVLLERGFAVNIVPLPGDEDPDSYVQSNGAEAFRELLRNSEPAYTYVLKVIANRHDLSRPAGKRAALEELVPMLNRIGEPIERTHAIAQTAEALDIEQHVVVMELNRLRSGQNIQERPVGMEIISLPPAEKDLLLAAAADAEECRKAVEDFSITQYVSPFAGRLLEEIFNRCDAGKEISFPSLSELAMDEAERRAIAALAVVDEDSRPANAWQCAAAIAVAGLKRELDSMGRKMQELERNKPDSDELETLFEERLRIKLRIKELETAIRSRNFADMDKKVG